MERGDSLIVRALVKACDGKSCVWPRLLPFTLWANRTTHSSVTGFMSDELIYGQKPIMPIEQSILSWSNLPWYEGMIGEELLALQIRQLDKREEDVATAVNWLQQSRLEYRKLFD